MFTGGHTGGARILLGRSLHRKGIFSEEEQRAGGQWVEGKLGGSSPQELHKQLPGSIPFRSKIVISGITDCETT